MASETGLVGGCYRVESQLGRGGVARVYSVVDQRSGQRLALKQLVAQGRRAATQRAMFEREYHTLVQLAHPRIVRVFDYGLDPQGPYYTLELLEGSDLKGAAQEQPLQVRAACLLLRDVATALSLIHSRRMVHRDLSTRNLWCTPDGHAKLIDFGTLVTMGSQVRAEGTPPFVPPEAVFAQPLDARCDVFGLGAAAYYLLTGQHAYPARAIGELRQQWQKRPAEPAALRDDVPQALSQLVMAMLHLEARGRPASMGEVFERLTAIARLPAEDEGLLAQAYLSSPRLVGRTEVSRRLRERLLRSVGGNGNAVAITAPAGMGRSRALSSVVLDAKLMGAATVAVDASAAGSRPLSLAAALAERLVEALPATATASAEVAGVLAHLSPELHIAMGKPQLTALNRFGRLQTLSSALVALITANSRRKPLVIAVDDVHRADSASLGILGRLSLLTDEHRLLLLTTCDQAALQHPPAALEQLVNAGIHIALPPLREEHTRELLGSLFGGVAGLDEAASWLHELSAGSPRTCMQYAQYLVDHRLARFEGGQWRLPGQLQEHGLPDSVNSMLEAKLRSVSDDARALCLGLAMARDETRSAWQPEHHVHIEDLPKLLDSGDAARAFHALDELLRCDIVLQRDDYYVLGQHAMVDVLLRLSSEQQQRAAHARLADVFEQEGYRDRMLTVRQRQLAGDDARACAQLVAYSQESVRGATDWDALRVTVNVECALRALSYWQSQGGSPRDGILLRRQLLMNCAAYDWSIASCADAHFAQLRADSGLAHWQQTDPSKPPAERLADCMKRAAREYKATPERERGFAPVDAVRELAAVSLPLAGALVYSHDLDRARSLPQSMEPLRSVSGLLELLSDISRLARARVRGEELGDRLLLSSNRLQEARELPDLLRVGGTASYLYGQAIEDARRGRKRALELMDRLAQTGGDDLFFVLHGRWLGHAFRGFSALADDFRKQVEMITEDDVWRRKAFFFAEAQLHALTGDLLSLHRVSDAMGELTQKFPGWLPWHAWSRGELHRMRGDLAAAEVELQKALQHARPGEHRAYVVAAPAHAELLLAQQRDEEAVRQCERIQQEVKAHSLDEGASIAASRIRALALSRRGEHEDASQALAGALQSALRLGYDGLPLAKLYESQARIALLADDQASAGVALSSLRRLLEHADAPALVGPYESAREELSRKRGVSELPVRVSQSRVTLSEPIKLIAQVRKQLDEPSDKGERARRALRLLLRETGATEGHLFLLDVGGVYAAASSSGAADEHLRLLAQRHLEAELSQPGGASVTTDDGATEVSAGPLHTASEGEFAPVLLHDAAGPYPMLVGLALLSTQHAPLRMARNELVRAISSCLLAAGDSVPVALDA